MKFSENKKRVFFRGAKTEQIGLMVPKAAKAALENAAEFIHGDTLVTQIIYNVLEEYLQQMAHDGLIPWPKRENDT